MGRRRRKKKARSIGGLGTRYGATVRKQYAKTISGLKGQKCPQCSSGLVRRKSVGVWKCGKCGFTVTGGAYTPITKLGVVSKRVAKGATLEVRPKAKDKG